VSNFVGNKDLLKPVFRAGQYLVQQNQKKVTPLQPDFHIKTLVIPITDLQSGNG
jgi:hypothetical protein